jgi:hypothetical protein
MTSLHRLIPINQCCSLERVKFRFQRVKRSHLPLADERWLHKLEFGAEKKF